MGGLPLLRKRNRLCGCQNGPRLRGGRLNGADFVSHGRCRRRLVQTWSACAEAHGWFEAEHRLRSINEMLPINRPAADLLCRKFLDEHHAAAAEGTAPSGGRLRLAISMRLGTWLRADLQQLLTEGQKLFPAPVRLETGKANAEQCNARRIGPFVPE